MSARAGIVVTGTEVLTGIIPDRNGPWLSERLREIGVDHAHTVIVGDRAEDVHAALEFLRDEGMDLIVTSGGLGPTADDLTAEVVAAFQGRAMVLDEALEQRIWNILERFARRWSGIDLDAVRVANRKQAIIPEGSTIIEPVGTAPGLVVPPATGTAPTVLVLPGPPRELHPMWETAQTLDAFAASIAAATRYDLRMLRLIGIPESEIAETLRQVEGAGVPIGELEITTCLRRGEIEIATRYEPQHAATYEALAAAVRERYPSQLFSEDSATIDDIVTGLLLGPPGQTVAVAESCTGGLLAARLTERPGSSEYMLGGLTVYSNEAKAALAGVEESLIERFGAVSIEVAEALATGARERFGADIGIGVTGVAGPGGGTEEKPVGRVCLSVATGDGSVTRQVDLPGDRASVRERAVTVAFHLLRRVLLGGYDDADTRGATTLTGR